MTEQLALVSQPEPPRSVRVARRKPAADRPAAQHDPIATVLIDTPLAHLDRPFEYLVPAELDADAQPGVRVRVRFSGRDHRGYLIERRADAEHEGRLTPLRTVVSPERVLTPEVLAAARAVADHYGGTVADVLRLAVPPRHARAEKSVPAPGEKGAETPPPEPGAAAEPEESDVRVASLAPWSAYPAGAALLRRIEAGQAPAASWVALPNQPADSDWPAAVAAVVLAARRGGRGAVVVVPDHRDVDRLIGALRPVLDADDWVRLTADQGPQARYSAYLRLLRGHARVAVGTRSAAWAPVRDPGLFLCWDDGDDLLREPRSPYPHVREVLRIRSRAAGAALVLGGLVRSVEVHAWVRGGAVAEVGAPTATVRATVPAVVVAGEGMAGARDAAAHTARMPSIAWRALSRGLEAGPVLVQVPRQGYVVSVTCADCRTPVRCSSCEGPVGISAGGRAPACRWCGATAPATRACRSCGSPRVRAATIGAARTAEELGRAFPGVRLISSGGAHVVPQVPAEVALVVATPGAEPVAVGGYHAVVLLDGWRLLDRAALDASAEALRRWCAAATLMRPRSVTQEDRKSRADAGSVVLCGVPPHAGVPAVEALVRWDPVGLADREWRERVELGLPPAVRHALVRGPVSGVVDLVAMLVHAGHVALGPAMANRQGDAAVVVREGGAGSLAAAVQWARAARSAHKASEVVVVRMDVADLVD